MRRAFGCPGWPVLVWSLPSASQGMLEHNIFPPHVFPSLSLPLAQPFQAGLGWAEQSVCDRRGETFHRAAEQPSKAGSCSQSEVKALWSHCLILTSYTENTAQHWPLESSLPVIEDYWLWWWSALVRTGRWEELFSLGIAMCHLVCLQHFLLLNVCFPPPNLWTTSCWNQRSLCCATAYCTMSRMPILAFSQLPHCTTPNLRCHPSTDPSTGQKDAWMSPKQSTSSQGDNAPAKHSKPQV